MPSPLERTAYPAFVRCAAAILLLLPAACGGRSDQASPQLQSGTRAEALPANELQALPAISSLPALRWASIEGQLTQEGDAAVLSSLDTVAVPVSALQINAGPTEVGYAIYGFALGDATETIDSITANVFDVGPGGDQFMAISNFAEASWEIIILPAEGTGAQSLVESTIRSAADYMRADGTCFVAVLAWDQATISVDSVSLEIDGELGPPQNVLTNGTAPLATHFDRIEISWTPTVLADGYDLYFRPSSAGPEGEFTFLAALDAAEISSFNHTASEPAELPCPYNEVCEYKLKSRNGANESAFSNTAVGLRSVPPPAEVTCREEVTIYDVEILYSGVPGAIAFRIYRDTPDSVPILTSDSNNAHDDEVDFAKHSYFVRSVCEEGDGLFTQASLNQGSRIELTTHSLLENGSGNDATKVSMAIIGGRPAFAFSRNTIDTLGYAYAKGDEPAASGDWMIINAADAEVASVALVEHAGKPWILYHDTLSNPDNVRIARANQAFPISNGDWTRYSIYDAAADTPGVRLIESDGLLRGLISTVEADGGELLYATALDSEPLQAEWELVEQNTLVTSSRTIDLALINGNPAVIYSNVTDLFYASTESSEPEPEDWTTHHAVTSIAGVIFAADLVQRASGVPAVGWLEDRENFDYVFYSESSSPTPTDVQDWRPNVEITLADGAREVVVGEYLDRPMILFMDPNIANSDEVTVWQFADQIPTLDSDWKRYEIEPSGTDREMISAISFLSYDGRPAMLVVEEVDATFETFPRFARIQPKP